MVGLNVVWSDNDENVDDEEEVEYNSLLCI